MPLSPEIADDVLAACRASASEVAEALSRALGEAITIDAEKIETFRYAGTPAEWNGPGLAFILKVGEEAALAILPSSSGLVPSWSHNPDPTGKSKLSTLAQELGMTLLPEEHMPYDFAAGYVENLAKAVERGQLATSAGAVHLVLQSGDKSAALRLVWPLHAADSVLEAPPAASPAKPVVSMPVEEYAGDPKSAEELLEDRLCNLPSYVRSLLRIAVPVSVQLAAIKQPVSRILNIGPGSIIQFERNCEQPLTLCIGDQIVAEGEAVKVGEKFGIKLTSMVLPGERFFALRGTRA